MTPSRNDSIFHQVVCRPALPLDTRGMLELTSQIWEGDDYVPKVWQEWLFDPQGLLAVAEFRGKIVGIGKLTRLSKQDWWLEGLRVHPEFEGQRIASRIQSYLLEIWERLVLECSVLQQCPVVNRLNISQLLTVFTWLVNIPRSKPHQEGISRRMKIPFHKLSRMKMRRWLIG